MVANDPFGAGAMHLSLVNLRHGQLNECVEVVGDYLEHPNRWSMDYSIRGTWTTDGCALLRAETNGWHKLCKLAHFLWTGHEPFDAPPMVGPRIPSSLRILLLELRGHVQSISVAVSDANATTKSADSCSRVVKLGKQTTFTWGNAETNG